MSRRVWQQIRFASLPFYSCFLNYLSLPTLDQPSLSLQSDKAELLLPYRLGIDR